MGYDPVNKLTLIVWTNLTVSLDQKPTANTLMLKVLDQVYALSPLATTPASAASVPSDGSVSSARSKRYERP